MQNPTKNNNNTVHSGSTELKPNTYGFDFSTESTIEFDRDSAYVSDEMNDIDVIFQMLIRINPWVKDTSTNIIVMGSPIFEITKSLNGTYGVMAIPDTSLAAILVLNNIELSSIQSVPEIGYESAYDSVQIGNTFAIITQDQKYSIIKIRSINEDTTIIFDWLYQSNGSRNFK